MLTRTTYTHSLLLRLQRTRVHNDQEKAFELNRHQAIQAYDRFRLAAVINLATHIDYNELIELYFKSTKKLS